MTNWRTAVRSVLRRRAFSLTTILVLAAGIGANSALFSIVDTVLLKPLPYPHGERLLQVLEANPAKAERDSLVAPARLMDWKKLSRTFEAISGSYTENATDTSLSEPERLAGRRVAPDYFSVFGMPALLGRTFNASEERFGGPKAAVISEGLWARRYSRDPHITSRRMILNGGVYLIAGVMPKAFAPTGIDVWIPAQLNPGLMQVRQARFLVAVGRMKAGITLDQARNDLHRVSARLAEIYPETDKGWSVSLTDYKVSQTGASGGALWLFGGAAGFLLIILCANVAGLLLSQLRQRQRELAIRGSLGGTRVGIIGLVLQEATVLVVSGAALGAATASLLIRAIPHWVDLPRLQELRFDWRVTAFIAAVAAGAVLISGLIPALGATSGDLNAILLQGGRSQAGGRSRLQQVLVAAQFGITMILLAGAGLLLRSYQNLVRVQPGFEAASVITFHVGAGWDEDRELIGVLQERLLSEWEHIPGVRAAGLTNFLPASEATLREQIMVEGLARDGETTLTAGTRMVSAGYLSALRIPLLAGSSCPSFQSSSRTPRALVNRAFAETTGLKQIVGRRLVIKSAPQTNFLISGVAGDVREDALNTPAAPYIYTCIGPGNWPDPEYVVAVNQAGGGTTNAIREVVHRLAPQRAVFGMTTLANYLERSIETPRLDASVVGVFAGSALFCAAIGLYGLVALTVQSRRREIGIRIALGASAARILGSVVAGALWPLVAATAAGAAVAIPILTAFRKLYFDVGAADAFTLGATLLILAGVAIPAAAVPARRAIKVDPLDALRSE